MRQHSGRLDYPPVKPGRRRRSPTDDRRVGRLPCRNRLSRGGGSLKSANLPDGRRAKAAIRLENRQARGQLFLKALFAISRWSGLKRA